jgi:hypothetical protein
MPAAAFAGGGWMIDARGGLALPMGDFGNEFKSGLLIGVDASHMMSPQLALGFDGNYIKNGVSDDNQAALDATFGPGTDASAKFMHYGVHAKYMMSTKESKMTPYLVGGLGLYNVKVQVTPPGSGCSIIFGEGVTSMAPGSLQGLQLSVYDIDEARADLVGHGVDVSEPFHDATGIFHHAGTEARETGAAPDHADYGSFAAFSDPDGNGWLLQEIKTRLPGR